MKKVLLGVGSNIEPRRNISSGIGALGRIFGELACSSVYQCQAVGFAGPDFHNLAVLVYTDKSIAEICSGIRDIEMSHGRTSFSKKLSSRLLDIDILTVDDIVGERDGVRLPRPGFLEQPYVLGPLAELVPKERHPQIGKTYELLWQMLSAQRGFLSYGNQMGPLLRLPTIAEPELL